jgi:RHS repeat-associated protein
MKAKRMSIIGLTLLGLLLDREVQAFYDPTIGRWISRDPIEETSGEELVGHKDWVARARLNLCVFVENNSLNYYDFLGLAKPTKETGAAEIAGAAEMLKGLCRKCCKCTGKSVCSAEECEKSAQAMINAILAAWNDNFGKGKNKTDDAVGGYLCWDWARSFERHANEHASSCWTITQHAIERISDDTKHFYVEFNACKNETSDCSVMLDDGYFDSGMFHSPPWPSHPNWRNSEWKVPEGPGGRGRYTPPPIK